MDASGAGVCPRCKAQKDKNGQIFCRACRDQRQQGHAAPKKTIKSIRDEAKRQRDRYLRKRGEAVEVDYDDEEEWKEEFLLDGDRLGQYIERHPMSARRIQGELRDKPLLSVDGRREAMRNVGKSGDMESVKSYIPTTSARSSIWNIHVRKGRTEEQFELLEPPPLKQETDMARMRKMKEEEERRSRVERMKADLDAMELEDSEEGEEEETASLVSESIDVVRREKIETMKVEWDHEPSASAYAEPKHA